MPWWFFFLEFCFYYPSPQSASLSLAVVFYLTSQVQAFSSFIPQFQFSSHKTLQFPIQNLPMASQHADKLNPTNKSLHDLCLTNTPDSFPITMPVLILFRSTHSSSLAVRGVYRCFLYYGLYLENFSLKLS